MPEPLREARVDPGRRGAVVFVSVALLAGIVAAVAVWSTGPSPQPLAATVLAPVSDAGSAPAAVQRQSAGAGAGAEFGAGGAGAGGSGSSPSVAPDVPPVDPPASGGSSAAADRSAPQEVVVSVTGRVATPGLVTLPAGSRVADAVAAAGGPTAEADLTGLNLAARLADGDSVVIGGGGQAPPAGVSRLADGGKAAPGPDEGDAPSGGTPGPLDLNSADQTDLEELPGVGPVMAQAILAWRMEHGAFTDVGQLQEVSGIGPARYAQLQPLVTV